jgi:universal stress protein A
MAFQKILCPVDFSPESQQAMRVAVRIANQRDAELVLVHAWCLPPVAFAREYMYPARTVQWLSDDAQRGLDGAVAEASRLGARHVTSSFLSGTPWKQIVAAARREPAFELIVIGTRARTALARFLFGSVTEMVVHHAPCPVLTVRLDNAPATLAHVLGPVDPPGRESPLPVA